MQSLLLLLLSSHLIYSYEVVLETQYGRVGGFKFKTSKGTISDIVLNIPYAKPPVGDLRWEKPQPSAPWTGIRNGTDFGFQCVPHAKAAVLPAKEFKEISEDCLTMNVIKPTTKPPPEGFPILVWIHGGGYQIGSQTLYRYEGFANIYNPEDILVVTFQYRIGVYGFASSGTSDFAGNYGLWDQTLALKFIHDNAHRWDGNAEKLTVLGQSAGAGSTALLSISPHSRDYMRAAIIVSGNAYASWARGEKVPGNSMKLAQALNCMPGRGVKECMKKKSIEEVFDAVERTGYLPKTCTEIKYGPRVDFDFFPRDPAQLLLEAPPKPIVIGTGDKDFAYFTYMARSTYIQPFYLYPEQWQQFDRKEFIKRIEREVVSDFFKENRTFARDEIIKRFVDAPYEKKKEYDWYLTQYTEMLNDIAFSVPAHEEALLRTKAKSDVYLFRFDHYNEALFPHNLTTKLMKGSPHTNEYEYMFERNVLAKFSTDTPDERKIKDIVQQSFISLVKDGVPRNDHVEWKKTSADNLRFLVISTQPKMLDHYYDDAADFWHRMRRHGFDMVTAEKSVQLNGKYVPLSESQMVWPTTDTAITSRWSTVALALTVLVTMFFL